ncbi:MAG: sterol desaturase family protein [Geobacteraceae bacterium]|nr:sterol desaturase family protein [Geobacteraceae bacterium]
MPEEQTIRIIFFLGTLLTVAAWEIIAPRRPLQDSKSRRWLTNLSLVLLNTLTLRLLAPLLPVGLAHYLHGHGVGVLHLVSLPDWVTLLAAVLFLDLTVYLQHVLFHFLPALWRFHRMHHTDLDIDVTTGNRFHPVEIALSAVIKLAAICLLGPPVAAVVIFEVVLNASSQFNHGNIRIPGALDRWLRLIVVTPDMHRVHHSVIPRETNSNFGFNVPWWDRLFGTYRPEPEQGHLGMGIGLREYRNPVELTLGRLLLLPFLRYSVPSTVQSGQPKAE